MTGSVRAALCVAPFLVLAACGSGDGAPEAFVSQRGGDVVGAGEVVRLELTVPGDVMVAGGDVAFTGQAGGDYLGVGGRQAVAGAVGGSTRVAGGEVVLSARVARNATLVGGRVALGPSASVDGNAYLAGGEVEVAGTVGRLLRVSGGRVILDGRVEGDVNAVAGELVLGPSASIAGDLRYRVPEGGFAGDPRGAVEGNLLQFAEPPRAPGYVMPLLWALPFLVTGTVLVALLPRASASAAGAVERRFWGSLGTGALALLLVPMAAALMASTVVGVPLAVITVALYAMGLYLAPAVVALEVGRLVLPGRRWRGDRGGAVAAFLTGGVALLLVGLVPVLGVLVWLMAVVLGLGSVAVAAREASRRTRVRAAAATPLPPPGPTPPPSTPTGDRGSLPT